MTNLRIEPCRDECAWGATEHELDGEPLFACRSCGSEWVPSQEWTPIDADGVVPDEIAKCRRSTAD
ncbi:hypothetical protein [Yimella sp. cx-51]|uniref:hypothetical protein n=1 Tax=Yimella sp. cx-51 TaxID=2770551 RepID=UPI001AD85157|nr:hypothetical protein [Yimella sp. cx-51]QTH36809.1 hypothetical protein J5M86_07505 [Yimella sp. cx-51]